ncbi:MAG: tetratricopeptide (TPR) repeat protein [Chlamydiales bacterium]|jgi:tetratricopeptide (TPR) repeat protein
MLTLQDLPGVGRAKAPRSLAWRSVPMALPCLLLGLAPLVAAHSDDSDHSIHDRVLELEIRATDPTIEGHGPSIVEQYEVGFSGTLHIWTRSDQDLFLRANDLQAGSLLGEDEDSGGGTTPYLMLDVQEGSTLAVTVAGKAGASGAPFELCFAAVPALESVTGAVALGQETLAAVAELRAGISATDIHSGELHVRLATDLVQVLSGSNSGMDEALAGVLGLLAVRAEQLQIPGPASAARRTLVLFHDRTRPATHADVLDSRLHLAANLFAIRDRAGASALLDGVVQSCTASRSPSDPILLRALAQLAQVRRASGDYPGALDLQQRVVNVRLGELGKDDPAILSLRNQRAMWLAESGDLDAAVAIQRGLLDDCQRVLPANDPIFIQAQRQLALSLGSGGDFRSAVTLQKAALAGLEAIRPADHPQLLGARLDLADSFRNLGEFRAAYALQQQVVAAYSTIGTVDRVGLLRARGDLALTLIDLGDVDGARVQTDALALAMQGYVLDSLVLSPGQIREVVLSERDRLGQVLYLATLAGAGSAIGSRAIELGETMRWVTADAGQIPDAQLDDPQIAGLLAARAGLQSNVAGLALAPASDTTLVRISTEGDRIDEELRGCLAGRGLVAGPVNQLLLAAALRPDEVAVGYRRISHWDRGPTRGQLAPGIDHLVASVIRPDGSFAWIDLGPMAEIELLISAWRASIGQPVGGGSVSIRVSQAGSEADTPSGRRLRQRVLDPILVAAGDQVRSLFVVPDDSLFLIPLDGLPLESGERVGDRVRIVNEVSFACLLAPYIGPLGPPGLLVVGGVDHGAARGGARSVQMTRLSNTGSEAQMTAALFQGLTRSEAVLLTRRAATKSALFTQAPGMRFLHLAVQGWIGQQPQASSLRGLKVASTAPQYSQGLALAQANLGQDSFGRYPGILTFEDLYSLDLYACELAVVTPWQPTAAFGPSAEVIQTLQTALQAAGARSSLTSLWPVDEEAARALLNHFYTQLWSEELGKADALWQAKQALRDEGRPPAHWAGWVLTGDPN